MEPLQLQAKSFGERIFSMEGISRRNVEEHLKLYQGYVNKSNELSSKLQNVDYGSANQTYSDLREMKVELTFAIGGVKNHEIYFSHLGGRGGQPSGALAQMIERDFGSHEAFATDMAKTGIAARGWVWLAYDWDFNRLMNVIGDTQNTFPVWNASPLVGLDVYEHAYFMDYGTNRSGYIDAFMANMDWGWVQERVEELRIPTP